MQPRPHYQRYLQPAAPFQQTFGPNTQAGIDLTNLIYAGLKTRQAAVEVVPPVDQQQAEPASNTPEEPSLVQGADSTVQEEEVDFFKECMVQKEFPKVPTETAALEADLKSPIVSEGAEGNEAIEMPEMEEELSTAPWVGETGSNYPIFCGGLGAPDSEASSLQDGKICLETPVDALASSEADQEDSIKSSPLPVESHDAAAATSTAEVETRVYAPSSMLRMRLATLSDAEDCLGIKVKEVVDVLPPGVRDRTQKRSKAEKKKAKASQAEVACPTVQSMRAALFQMAVGQQRLEKTGGFKISTVRTLHSIDALLEQLQSSVRVHLPNQAARSIQSYWRRHMQYMDVKKRQEQREEAGKASKAQLREEMQRLAEERQKEQIKIPKSGTRSSAGAPPVVAPARFGSGAQSTPIGAPPVKSQSQVGASTSSAMEAAPGEPEKLAKVKEDFEDLEAAPGLESQDGKIGDLLSAKDVGECDGDLGEKDEDSAGKMEHQTLTEGRLEGKEILEQILPEPVVSRCFADVETFDLPTQAPVTSEIASECSASQKSLEKEREEQRETLRSRMRALAEERQAEEAKAVRRKAMKQLRQRVGPRPADATLHGLLSRCDGDVNRAATAFWNGLPFA